MAYARFSKGPGETRASDVYVFMSTGGWLECCGCKIAYEDGTPHGTPGSGSRKAFSTAGMVAHLREHAARGHYVPGYVIPAMEADDAENFPA